MDGNHTGQIGSSVSRKYTILLKNCLFYDSQLLLL